MDVTGHRARIGAEIDERIAAVVEHGKWIMGPEVPEFERALEDWVASPGTQAISCGNGTDALILAAQALGLKPGQAVVCPSFTFVATAEAVATLGGVPVFADVSEFDFNLDAVSVKAAIDDARSRGLEVVGLIAVDLFGQPADYTALKSIAREQECWMIADAAQSFGGARDGLQVGAMADVTTASFFPAKPLGCYGDGGAVFTADPEIADTIRSLRVHGKGTHKYDNVRIGQNSRLDTIQAAILLPKLGILDDELDARQQVADWYGEHLSDAVTTPHLAASVRSAWAQYTILVDDREKLQYSLAEYDIGHAVYYPKPLHEQTAYQAFSSDKVDLSVSNRLARSVLSLPMHPYMSESSVVEVTAVIMADWRGQAGR